MKPATVLNLYVHNVVVKCETITDVKGRGMLTKQSP